jgi:hypothetical protein
VYVLGSLSTSRTHKHSWANEGVVQLWSTPDSIASNAGVRTLIAPPKPLLAFLMKRLCWILDTRLVRQ